VLSSTRVAIGELPGNRLFDGAPNLAEKSFAALMVMVPGMKETLRIEGRAAVSTDEELRRATALDGKPPRGALVIDVDKTFTHCGKAFKRSRVGEPASWLSAGERSGMGAVLAAHVAASGPDGSLEPLPSSEAVEAGSRSLIASASGDETASDPQWFVRRVGGCRLSPVVRSLAR